MAARHYAFPPVIDVKVHTLILGSLPGAASLRAGRYYAHPSNQFWRLMGQVLEIDIPQLDYDARLAALLDRGFGLWDVIAEADREGSLDAALRNTRVHDLAEFVNRLPQLHTIAFNGAVAARIGMRQLGAAGLRMRTLALPSSSAAHAVPFRDKLARWMSLLPAEIRE